MCPQALTTPPRPPLCLRPLTTVMLAGDKLFLLLSAWMLPPPGSRPKRQVSPVLP